MTLGSSGNCTFRGTMSTEIFTLSLHDALPISKVLQTVAMEVNQGDHRIVPFRCDVTDRDEIEVMIGNVIEVWDRIDILVNNAGASGMTPIAPGDAPGLDEKVDEIGRAHV